VPQGDTVQSARTGFLLPDGFPNPPAEIPPARALQQYAGGVFLFFPALPDAGYLQALIQGVRSYLHASGLPGARFLWVQNPLGAGMSVTPLQVAMQGAIATTTRTAFITLAPNIALGIGRGTTIVASPDGMGLLLNGPVIAPNALLITPGGGKPEVTIPVELNEIELGIMGGNLPSGCFRLGISVGTSGLASLDVGLRYFTPYLGLAPPGYVQSLRYPLFDLGAATMGLTAVLDPLDALDPLRTYFTFKDGAALPSFFTSMLGNPSTLAPLVSARLVFAVKRTGVPADTTGTGSQSPGVPEPYYLTPAGEFALQIVGEEEARVQDASSMLNCRAAFPAWSTSGSPWARPSSHSRPGKMPTLRPNSPRVRLMS
jgi:hypothetical protein